MKYIAVPTLVVLLLATTTYAEEVSIDTTVNTSIQPTVIVEGNSRNESKKASLFEKTEIMKKRTVEFKAGAQVKVQERKDAFQAKRQEIKQSMEAQRAQFKVKLVEIKKEKISARKEFVQRHFEKTVLLLESRQARVKTLLEKMEANGKNVTKAKESLQVSIDELASAKVSLGVLVSTTATTEDQKAELKALSMKVETALRSSRDALLTVLRLVTPEVKTETTTTVQTDQ